MGRVKPPPPPCQWHHNRMCSTATERRDTHSIGVLVKRTGQSTAALVYFQKRIVRMLCVIKTFQILLQAKDFTLCTDHRPIVTKFYSTTRVASPRQEQFFDFISQITNKLKHVSGKENVADILNRPADPPLLNSILPNSAGIDYLKMAEEQQSNLDMQNLKQNNTTSLLLKDVPLGETGATLLCDDS